MRQPSMPPRVSIALIAKDEEKSIGIVLSQIMAVMRDRYSQAEYELFVVDGYSRDNTAGIVKSLGVPLFEVVGGKGDAVRMAFSFATGEYVLFFDADGSHVPEDIPRLIENAKDTHADLVIVSRKKGHSEELGRHSLDSFFRLTGNNISSFLINLRWGAGLTDAQNGFRIIRREVALGLGLREGGFAIEQEMVMKCLKGHKKNGGDPGLERRRLYGVSKIVKRKEFWKYVRSFLRELI